MEKLDLVIELRDLKNSVHLNGFKGVVVDYIFDEDRFIVKLTENKLVKVKPINMASPITIIMCKKVDILVS